MKGHCTSNTGDAWGSQVLVTHVGRVQTARSALLVFHTNYLLGPCLCADCCLFLCCCTSRSVLLYEMLCGVPPFRAKNRQALQQQITGAKPKFPKFLSSDVLNLLKVQRGSSNAGRDRRQALQWWPDTLSAQ